MYVAHLTQGARTRPNRTQPPTAAWKTTLNAGQCVRQPREGRGRNRQPPPPQKKRTKNRGGRGGGAKSAHSHQTARQHHKRRPNPPPRRHRRQDPQRGKEGPPSQNRQHQARNSGPPGKGTPKHADTHQKKKKGQQPSPKESRLGDRGHKALDRDIQQPTPQSQTRKPNKKKAQKTRPDNPAKKGGAQPRPGPSTHAHTTHRNKKRRGASRARTQPHTSHTQAET